MAEYLSTADWKKFVKEHDDVKSGLGLQLAEYERAVGKKDLLEQIAALRETVDQAKSTKSKYAKNKELLDYLDHVGKEADKKIKLLEVAAKKKAKEDEAGDHDKTQRPQGDAHDKNLLALIKRAKTATIQKPLRFAVVFRSAKDGALVLSKKKVAADQIKQARIRSGGGRVVARGTCFSEEGKLIFESPKDPPATLARAIRVYVFRDTGRKVKPICRASSSITDEDDVEAMPVDEAPTKKKGATDSQVIERLRRRLKSMALSVKKAINQQDPNAERMRVLVASINGSLKNGDPAHAQRLIKELQDLLGPGLALRMAKRYHDELANIEKQFKSLKAIKPKRAEKLAAALDLVRKRGEEQKFKEGMLGLATLKMKLAEALGKAPTDEPAVEGYSHRALVQSLQFCQALQLKVVQGLKSLEKDLYAACEKLNSDPRSKFAVDLKQVKAASKGLFVIQQRLEGRLVDRINAALEETDPARRRPLQLAAVDMIREHLAYVDTDPLIAAIEKSGLPSTLSSTIRKVLTGLATKLESTA